MIFLMIAILLHAPFAIWALVCFGAMIKGAIPKKLPDDGTVVVLGCKVKHGVPGLHLTKRIEAAAEFLKEHPNFNCVGTGGQGFKEAIPEGEAIKIMLVDLGIEPERIAIEDESVNTRENLENAIKIIREKGWNENIVIATDSFHQYRSNKYAKNIGLNSKPLNAKMIYHTLILNVPREVGAISRLWLFKR